jgi:hypothetical protein
MQDAIDSSSSELICRAHLIWMADSQDEPLVRILLVATGGIQAVYEGLKSWPDCWNWISKLLGDRELKSELHLEVDSRSIRMLLEREGLIMFPMLKIQICDLASHGFQRA